MQQIEITYEEEVQELPEELESNISRNLKKLMQKIGKENQLLSVHFCSIDTIRELNQSYRNKNKSTDILSWSYDDNDHPAQEHETWGELVLCLDVCKKQAEKNELNLETELSRLLVHGIAHLLGYNHEESEEEEEIMLKLEHSLLADLGVKNLYGGD